MRLCTIQELWDYCSFCPFCQAHTRTVSMSVGPDAIFSLNGFDKQATTLEISCVYKHKSNLYAMEYEIDCLTNYFDVGVRRLQVSRPEDLLPREIVSEAYFYWYVHGECYKCRHQSCVFSMDLELDRLNKQVVNIGLEQEVFRLFNETDCLNITIDYYELDAMYVSSIPNPGDIKPIKLPIFQLDLSNPAQALDKLKTLILFS